MIAGILAALPAYAAPYPAEGRPVRQEWMGRDQREPEKMKPEEKGPGKQDLEKESPGRQDLEKKTPEQKEPEKDAPKKVKPNRRKVWEEFAKDPISVLEDRKSEIEKMLKEGKISKEKAEDILKRIDTGISEIKRFNRLPLEEKRAMLIKDCKEYLDSLVEKGDLDKEQAQRILEEYSEKIGKWDGAGYPRFFRKGSGCGKQ